MAWIDQLERVKHPDGRELIGASFRGVPFFVDSSSRNGGRRFAKKEFIDHDIPKLIDLGKAGNVFRIEGYVVGADYMIQRDALLDALQEVAGAGTLVHPFYGRNLRVQVGTVGIRETKDGGGIAEFSIEFHNAPEVSAVRVDVDLDAAVADASVGLILENSADLEASLVTAGQPSYSLESLSEELSNLSAKLKEELSKITDVEQELAKMSQQLDLIAALSTSIIRTPQVMLEAFQGSIEALGETLETHTLDAINAMMNAYALPSVAPAVGDTDARVQERANQIAFNSALRIVLVTESARIAPTVDFATVEDANITRDRIVDAIDELVEVAEDSTYGGLINLRSSILRAIPGDALLARIVDVGQFADTPSLVLAYRFNGTVDGEADLIARNNVRHPGFVSGSLKVLSNV